MRTRKKPDQQIEKAIHRMDQNIETIAQNTVQSNRFKLPMILTFIGTAAAVIGVIIAFLEFLSPERLSQEEALAETDAQTASAYELYLYPEYKKLRVSAETDITATLNFDTDAVLINAYLDSAKSGDTVEMSPKSANEWQTRVYFEEAGIFEVIATATAPDGTVVKGTVEIEVIPAFEQ